MDLCRVAIYVCLVIIEFCCLLRVIVTSSAAGNVGGQESSAGIAGFFAETCEYLGMLVMMKQLSQHPPATVKFTPLPIVDHTLSTFWKPICC